MKLSISTRLALSYGLSLLLILCGFVVYLYWSFHIGLHQEFSAQLQRDKARLQQAIHFIDGELVLKSGQINNQLTSGFAGSEAAIVRVLNHEGTIVYKSPNLENQRFFAPQIPSEETETTKTASWQGRPTQSLYAPLLNQQGTASNWLEITRFESSMHNELHRLGWLLTTGIFIGAFCALVLGHWMARRALQPIAAITRAARDIQAESPQQRLPSDFGVRDELTDLAETLNDLLARLDASLERERRFRADAAHQMFTPLTAIQSEIEVALRRTRSEDEYRQSLQQVESQSKNLAGILEGLLQLSLAESITPHKTDAFNLKDLVLSRLETFRSSAIQKDISIQHQIGKAAQVTMHREHFRSVFDNLLENAIKYTPAGGAISVRIRSEKGETVLEIEDDGPGLTPDEINHIFDRFFRSERVEVKQMGGTGLGLSIVKAILEAYGGTISARSPGEGKGSIFTVNFTAMDNQKQELALD